LTAQQKQQRLAALDAAMPEALRKERDAVHVVTNVELIAAFIERGLGITGSVASGIGERALKMNVFLIKGKFLWHICYAFFVCCFRCF
jgi:hypothetical protein